MTLSKGLRHPFKSILLKYPMTRIIGLSSDSRTVKPGDVFFAVNSSHSSYSFNASPTNIAYIHQAIKNGATLIMAEKTDVDQKNLMSLSVPVLLIKNLRQKMGKFAAEFYAYPAKNMHIIGVTGTNGKTSCTHFLAQAFEKAGHKSGIIGTLGNGQLKKLQPSVYTTPDAVIVQQLLAEFSSASLDYLAIEASSQGLHQGRLNGTPIETGIFTNLTHDHLDYHQTLKKYAQAKFLLFKNFRLKNAVLNLDDAYGKKWAEKILLENHKNKNKIISVYGITTQPSVRDFFKNKKNKNLSLIFAGNIDLHPHGLNAHIITPWGKGILNSNLWGSFNLMNLLAALTSLCIYNLSLKQALSLIADLKNVPGRMQIFNAKNQPKIIVDYAHTPDALSKTLQAIRAHSRGKIWCIFGCGGDRDKTKRPIMGKIAEKYADHIILTHDNPRCENPENIIHDIRQGISNQDSLLIQPDRTMAIQQAIRLAKKNDIILIAGKGHENYQEIYHQKIPYSDILTVKNLLLI